MLFWEAIGRKMVAENTRSRADRIALFLGESGIDASVSARSSSDLYVVTVPADQEEKAQKALRIFYARCARADNEEISITYYREHCLSPQPKFIPSEEKFRTATNSSGIFMICGGIVLVISLVQFFLIAYHRQQGDATNCAISLLFGCIFILFGINNHQKVRFLQDKIMEENAFTDEVIRWCTSTYSADHIDKCLEAAAGGIPLTDEVLPGKRRDLIKDYILREYDIRDQAYLSYVADTIYKKLYFPNGISGFAC